MHPLIKHPPVLQVAALCHREGDAGTEVLLVSSSRGRWILPKGWPIDGLTLREAAQQEAWEEGGVKKTSVDCAGIQSFLGEKRFNNGSVVPCEIKVFPLKVKKISDNYPEAKRRDRIWASPARAAELVEDPGMKQVIESFAA